MPPELLHGGFWRLKALSWLLCACDFWQQIHYLPFLGPPARRAADGGRRGKAWPLEGIFIALRARGLFRCSLFGPPARRAAGGGGEGLSFGMRFLSACGRGAFLLLFIWAACAAGGRWGPVRGCRPSEAPSALPPDDPAGLSIFHQSSGLLCTHFGQSCWAFQLLPACEGCASFAAGASLPSVG